MPRNHSRSRSFSLVDRLASLMIPGRVASKPVNSWWCHRSTIICCCCMIFPVVHLVLAIDAAFDFKHGSPSLAKQQNRLHLGYGTLGTAGLAIHDAKYNLHRDTPKPCLQYFIKLQYVVQYSLFRRARKCGYRIRTHENRHLVQ